MYTKCIVQSCIEAGGFFPEAPKIHSSRDNNWSSCSSVVYIHAYTLADQTQIPVVSPLLRESAAVSRSMYPSSADVSYVLANLVRSEAQQAQWGGLHGRAYAVSNPVSELSYHVGLHEKWCSVLCCVGKYHHHCKREMKIRESEHTPSMNGQSHHFRHIYEGKERNQRCVSHIVEQTKRCVSLILPTIV